MVRNAEFVQPSNTDRDRIHMTMEKRSGEPVDLHSIVETDTNEVAQSTKPSSQHEASTRLRTLFLGSDAEKEQTSVEELDRKFAQMVEELEQGNTAALTENLKQTNPVDRKAIQVKAEEILAQSSNPRSEILRNPILRKAVALLVFFIALGLYTSGVTRAADQEDKTVSNTAAVPAEVPEIDLGKMLAGDPRDVFDLLVPHIDGLHPPYPSVQPPAVLPERFVNSDMQAAANEKLENQNKQKDIQAEGEDTFPNPTILVTPNGNVPVNLRIGPGKFDATTQKENSVIGQIPVGLQVEAYAEIVTLPNGEEWYKFKVADLPFEIKVSTGAEFLYASASVLDPIEPQPGALETVIANAVETSVAGSDATETAANNGTAIADASAGIETAPILTEEQQKISDSLAVIAPDAIFHIENNQYTGGKYDSAESRWWIYDVPTGTWVENHVGRSVQNALYENGSPESTIKYWETQGWKNVAWDAEVGAYRVTKDGQNQLYKAYLFPKQGLPPGPDNSKERALAFTTDEAAIQTENFVKGVSGFKIIFFTSASYNETHNSSDELIAVPFHGEKRSRLTSFMKAFEEEMKKKYGENAGNGTTYNIVLPPEDRTIAKDYGLKGGNGYDGLSWQPNRFASRKVKLGEKDVLITLNLSDVIPEGLPNNDLVKKIQFDINLWPGLIHAMGENITGKYGDINIVDTYYAGDIYEGIHVISSTDYDWYIEAGQTPIELVPFNP